MEKSFSEKSEKEEAETIILRRAILTQMTNSKKSSPPKAVAHPVKNHILLQ